MTRRARLSDLARLDGEVGRLQPASLLAASNLSNLSDLF